jgi:hypothetical protein
MIDFRYHLVSLVSVFLALAVGIVLGAGPLKEPIASGLSQSVAQLRQDRDIKSDQLKTAQAGLANRDTFAAAVQPQLVADQLGGRSVVLVTLPGADGDAIKPLTTAVTGAGAKVTGRIDVQNAWTDPADAAVRNRAVASLTAGLGVTADSPSRATPAPTPSGGTATQAEAAQLLARAVLTTELSASEKTDQSARTILDGLSRAGLIEVNGDVPGRATQAVLLVPGVTEAVDGARPSPSAVGSADPIPAWLTLAESLDAGSTGAVVTGPASAATSGGTVSAVRGNPALAGVVSTVDTGGTPMGDITTVLALREQQLGKAGHYGFGDRARAPLPATGAGRS